MNPTGNSTRVVVERYKVGAYAKLMRGCLRWLRPASQRVAPFLFTAAFGVPLSIGITGGSNLRCAIVVAGIAGVSWAVSCFCAARFARRVGTLYVFSALHHGSSKRELSQGNLADHFTRARDLPSGPLWDPDPGEGGGLRSCAGQVLQVAKNIGYARGDNARNTTEHLMVNGVWWFGVLVGAKLEAPRRGEEFIQWHVHVDKLHGELSGPGSEFARIGREEGWATDCMDLEPLFSLEETQARKAWERAKLQVERLSGNTTADTSCWLVLEISNPLPPGRSIPLVRDGGPTRESIYADVRKQLSLPPPLESLLEPSFIEWITAAEVREAAPGAPALVSPHRFFDIALALSHRLQEVLVRDPDRRIVVFARIPESLQLAVGIGLNALCRGTGIKDAFDRIYFAEWNQGTLRFEIYHGGQRPRAKKPVPFDGAEIHTIRNLTPHAVIVLDENDAEVARYEPGGQPAVLREHPSPRATFVAAGGATAIPVRPLSYAGTANLPGPERGVALLVSRLTAYANPCRRDLLFPASERRNAEGRIIGCRELSHLEDAVRASAS